MTALKQTAPTAADVYAQLLTDGFSPDIAETTAGESEAHKAAYIKGAFSVFAAFIPNGRAFRVLASLVRVAGTSAALKRAFLKYGCIALPKAKAVYGVGRVQSYAPELAFELLKIAKDTPAVRSKILSAALTALPDVMADDPAKAAGMVGLLRSHIGDSPSEAVVYKEFAIVPQNDILHARHVRLVVNDAASIAREEQFYASAAKQRGATLKVPGQDKYGLVALGLRDCKKIISFLDNAESIFATAPSIVGVTTKRSANTNTAIKGLPFPVATKGR